MKRKYVWETRKRILSGFLAVVCFCMAFLPFFEGTLIISRAGTFTGKNIWTGGSETMLGHSRNYFYRWSDGYQLTFCISPGKHMGSAIRASGMRTNIEDGSWPYISSEEDYIRLAEICGWLEINGASAADNATYAAAQTAVWAIVYEGWDSAEALESVVDRHVPGTYARWQALKAYVDESRKERPDWLETSLYLAKKNPVGMEMQDGIWTAEFDLAAYPKLTGLNWGWLEDAPGWNIEHAGSKLRFTYSGGQPSSAAAFILVPPELADWCRNTESLNFYIPEGDPSRIQAMISAGPRQQALYLYLSTDGIPRDRPESQTEPVIYEHSETFEAHYRVALDKTCAETGQPLKGVEYQVLEAFDESRTGGLKNSCMSPKPAVWDNFKVCADAATDENGHIVHTDTRKYEYVRTYCDGHPSPEYLSEEGVTDPAELEAIRAENALLEEKWNAQKAACEENTDFHSDEPGEGLEMMLEDRQRVYEEFIGLEYDYTFRETRARYGYILHGFHGDDEPVPVLRVPSVESGRAAEVIEREVVVNDSVGYSTDKIVGDTTEFQRDFETNVGIISKEILIERLRAAGDPQNVRGVKKETVRATDANADTEPALATDTDAEWTVDEGPELATGADAERITLLRVMSADVSLPEPIPDDEPWIEPSEDSGELSGTIALTDHRTEGEIHINKRDMQLKAGESGGYDSYGDTQGDATLEGAVYGLYAAEDIVHPDGTTGVVYRAGDLVAVAATDKNGDASFMACTEESETSRTAENLDGSWIGHPLLLGHYQVREIARSEGYELTAAASGPELSGRADVTTPMGHPIDMHDGSWTEFEVTYKGTVNGFDILISGYPENTEFYRSRMVETSEQNKVWTGSELVETGEFEMAEAGEYRLDADGNYIPKKDGEGKPLYDMSRPVMRTYPVTRRLNYYPAGDAEAKVDPGKWADMTAVDPEYVKAEAESVLEQTGYLILNGAELQEAPWTEVTLEGSTNRELILGIRAWFLENSFWDSGAVNRVWEADGSWHALLFHDYKALTGRLYVRIDAKVADMGTRHMYVCYEDGDYTMERGYATVASVRQKEPVVFGERMEDATGPEYALLYEQYEEGQYRLDGNGQKIPVREWRDLYEIREETGSEYELTPVKSEYDPISGAYRIHVDTKKEWTAEEPPVTETFRAVTKEKTVSGNSGEEFFSDYLLNMTGAGASAYVTPAEEPGTSGQRPQEGGQQEMSDSCLVRLIYPGQICPSQDGEGRPGQGTRLVPAGVQERGIVQTVKVIKDIRAEDGSTEKEDNFRFKAYLKSNLQRLYRDADGNVTWLDRRGEPLDVSEYLRVYPGLVPDLFTKVSHDPAVLTKQRMDAVRANPSLYEAGAREPADGYTSVLEMTEQEIRTDSGTQTVTVPNYEKFFDAMTVANLEEWGDGQAGYTSHRPLGNAMNRSGAAEENASASDLVRQFAIDWYLDGEVEAMSGPTESSAYGDQFYDEALNRAIEKAQNYLKPFRLYDLDAIYAVLWDPEQDGGSDGDRSTLSADTAAEEYCFAVSESLPYGTYVIAEQQPYSAKLQDFRNRHYRIDSPKEITVPSVYAAEEGADGSDILSDAYIYESEMGLDAMTERYGIRFGEESHVLTAHNSSGSFEIYKYGLALRDIENGTDGAGGDAHFALTQSVWKPYPNYYNDLDDQKKEAGSYYLSGGLDGREEIGRIYHYSSVTEEGGTADGRAAMTGMLTACDGLYSAALVPVSPERAAAAAEEGLAAEKDGQVEEARSFALTGDGSSARVRFRNTHYGAKLRIEKLDSETRENLLHDDAVFGIYRAARDESPDGEGHVLFYEKDQVVSGSREFLAAMGAMGIRQTDADVWTGVIPAGTPVCEEADRVVQTDAAGVRIGEFLAFSTTRDGVMEAADAEYSDGAAAEAGAPAGSGDTEGLQNVGYLETPEPLDAGVYVLAELKAPDGYVRSKPIAVEIYSDRVAYYQRGEKDSRVAAAVYASGRTDAPGAQESENGGTVEEIARIYVENTPTQLSVEKLKEPAGEGRSEVTFRISGRVDGSLAQIGGDPDYEYAYRDGVYMGYAWKKGTLEYLSALKAAGEDVDIVYHGSLFAGYGYLTRTLTTADDANRYVTGARMTLYEAIELQPTGDSGDMAYAGLVTERSGAGTVARMYVKEGFAGSRTEFVQEQTDDGEVWDAKEVQRPDTDILFYDLGGLELLHTESVDGRRVTYAYGRNHENVDVDQLEEDKKLYGPTDGGSSIFAFAGGRAVLELEGGDFTKISYSENGMVFLGEFARPQKEPDGSVRMSEGVKVYHLDEEGNRECLVDPYTGMAYAVGSGKDGAIRILVWPVKIERDSAGHVLARDKITTSRIAAAGESGEERYLTGTWEAEAGEQSHHLVTLRQNRFGQNQNEEQLLTENSGIFNKSVEPVYDEHGLPIYYRQSEETYETGTELYDRSGRPVRQKEADLLGGYDEASYLAEAGEETVIHRQGENYLLENTWITGESTPDDPFDDRITEGQADLLRRVPAGAYIMEELTAPEGYIKGLPTGVIVEETGELQKTGMTDFTTKLLVSKVDGAEDYTVDVLNMGRTDAAGSPARIGAVTENKSAYSQEQTAGARLTLYEAERVYTTDLENYPGGTNLRRKSDQPLKYLSTDSRAGAVQEMTAEWTTGETPLYLEGLPAGEYLLEETGVPEGMVTPPAMEVVVDPVRQVQCVTLYNDHTKLEIEKYAVEQGESRPVNGAGFTVYKAVTDDHGNVVFRDDDTPDYDTLKPVEHFVTDDGRRYDGFAEAFEEQYRHYGTEVQAVSWEYEGQNMTAVCVSHTQIDASVSGGNENRFPTTAQFVLETDDGKMIRVAAYGQKEGLAGRDFTFEYQYDYHKIPEIGVRACSYLTAEGMRRFDYLPVGVSYVLVETEVPAGYAGAAPVLLTAQDTGDVQRYRVINEEGSLVIAKTAASLGGKELSGARLALYRAAEDGQLIQDDSRLAAVWISGQDGSYTEEDELNGRIPAGYAVGDLRPHTLRRLPEGKYWLVELESPDYYTTFEPVLIDYRMEDRMRVVRVSDTAAEGAVEIRKRDPEGMALTGAVFEVSAYRQPDLIHPVFTRRFSDSGGTAALGGLPLGEAQQDGKIIPYCYRLREIVPPEGYAVDPQVYSFEFGPDRNGVSYTWGEEARYKRQITDKKTRITLRKRDFSEALVDGAEMAVYPVTGTGTEGSYIYDTDAPADIWFTSAEAPDHVIRGLTAGQTYVLAELAAPSGYQLMEPVAFTLSEDGRRIASISSCLASVTIRDLCTLTLRSRYAVRTEVTVTDAEDRTAAAWTASGDGHRLTEADGIRDGEVYTWTERTVYSDGSEVITNRVTRRARMEMKEDDAETNADSAEENGEEAAADGMKTGICMVPDRRPVRVQAKLTRADGPELASYEPSEDKPELLVGDPASEKELFEPGRQYILTETTYFSDGSRIETGKMAFEIGSHGEICAIAGYDAKLRIVISKTDITGENEIPGAVLQILDENGVLIEEWVSETTPHQVEAELEPGKIYRLKEILSPDGYAYASEIPFAVTAEGSDGQVVMTDEMTHVSVTKTDITGEKELEGAKLQILDENGTVTEEWISGKKAHEIVGKLTAGKTYTLHEEAAPAGYAYAEDIVFTVSEDGRIDRVVMKDEVLPERPHTPRTPQKPEPKSPGTVEASYEAYLIGPDGVPLGGPRYTLAPATGDALRGPMMAALAVMALSAVSCLAVWKSGCAGFREKGRKEGRERGENHE